MREKAISTVLMAFIFMIVTIGMFLTTYIAFIGGFLDIRAILERVEVERHNVQFTQVLLSSDKLTYADSSKSFRGVLDKNKLDEQFKSYSQTVENIIAPNTVVKFQVKDLVSKTNWQSFAYEKEKFGDIDSCLTKPNSKIESCMPSSLSVVGSSSKTYPTAIKISDDEVHLGRIIVSFVEVKI